MGWVLFALIGIAAAALLVLLGLGRQIWAFAFAALMLGASGYVLQGSPGLPGSPTKPDSQTIPVDPGLIALRGQMFGRFTGEDAMMVTADGLLRAGASDSAVRVLLGAIRGNPRNVALWTDLGDVLAQHDGGQVSPTALFAFQQAMRLNPRHPGPPFFLGLAYIRAGNFIEARTWWQRALALTPEGADYRAAIAVRLDLLDRYLAMAGAG